MLQHICTDLHIGCLRLSCRNRDLTAVKDKSNLIIQIVPILCPGLYRISLTIPDRECEGNALKYPAVLPLLRIKLNSLDKLTVKSSLLLAGHPGKEFA